MGAVNGLREQIVGAVDFAMKADRQNAAKWEPLYAVFKKELGVPPGEAGIAAKLVTEEKQTSNRISKELADKRPRYIVLSLGDVTPEYVRRHLDESKLPGAAAVLIFDGKKPRQILVAERDSVVDALLKAFDGVEEVSWKPQPDENAPSKAKNAVFRKPRSPSGPIQLSSGKLVPPSKRTPNPLVGLDGSFWAAVAALRCGRHVVLFGPPGTGKTELAEWLCQQLLEDPTLFEFATATSDWTTFDTIGGYIPDPELDGQLDFSSGIVTRTLETGRWLIIDELNRADIDKAFGELFTLLSGKPVRLPYKKLVYSGMRQVVLGPAKDSTASVIEVPDGWRLLGTMNSYDKASLFQLSFAFMRRFAFINVPVPDEADYTALLEAHGAEAGLEDEVTAAIVGLFAAKDGLTSLGVPVGPAIPLDIIRFSAESSIDTPEGLLTAFEAFLLPQFEGQDRKHSELAKRIASTLQLPNSEIEGRLAVWTGYEPG